MTKDHTHKSVLAIIVASDHQAWSSNPTYRLDRERRYSKEGDQMAPNEKPRRGSGRAKKERRDNGDRFTNHLNLTNLFNT